MCVPLIKDFLFNAPVEAAWWALTDVDALRRWYCPRISRFEPVVGFAVAFEVDHAIEAWLLADVGRAASAGVNGPSARLRTRASPRSASHPTPEEGFPRLLLEWTVTEVETGRTLSHSWSYHGYRGASEVTFDVFPAGRKTKLEVTHTGLETFPNQPRFKRARFDARWDALLGENLRRLLEHGS